LQFIVPLFYVSFYRRRSKQQHSQGWLVVCSFYSAPVLKRRVCLPESNFAYLYIIPLEKPAWGVQQADGRYYRYGQYRSATAAKVNPCVYRCFPTFTAARLNWGIFEGNREQIHSKFSKAVERRCDP